MEPPDLEDKVVRRVEGGRLVYYKRMADSAYWDEHWDKLIRPEFYAGALDGQLGEFEGLFTKYLPTDERILEAGCGPAYYVLALQRRGYHVEGVDWAKQTIERVKHIFPELPIRSGDVCALDVEEGFYGAYISFGVVEHRAAGPEPFLAEAFRILRPGGVAIVSVPWFNPLRRLKSWAGCFNGNNVQGMEFYQYAFSTGEMKAYLTATGFEVVEDSSSQNIRDGFEDEIPYLNRIYRGGIPGEILKRVVRKGRVIGRFFGHSRIYVCRKP
jgi:SAM-dependent methyltransferase